MIYIYLRLQLKWSTILNKLYCNFSSWWAIEVDCLPITSSSLISLFKEWIKRDLIKRYVIIRVKRKRICQHINISKWERKSILTSKKNGNYLQSFWKHCKRIVSMYVVLFGCWWWQAGQQQTEEEKAEKKTLTSILPLQQCLVFVYCNDGTTIPNITTTAAQHCSPFSFFSLHFIVIFCH